MAALSTAEAELYAATLGWQIIEGLRHLLAELGVVVEKTQLQLDNRAALTIAECGAQWRTRYFGVRASRLHKEHTLGRVALGHSPTAEMIADSLTKLASAQVLAKLHAAMQGRLPTTTCENPKSTDPGSRNRGDCIADGPGSSPSAAAALSNASVSSMDVLLSDVPTSSYSGLLTALYAKFEPAKLDRIPEVIKRHEAQPDQLLRWLREFLAQRQLDDEELHDLIAPFHPPHPSKKKRRGAKRPRMGEEARALKRAAQ